MIDTLRLTAEEANDLLERARSRAASSTPPTATRSTSGTASSTASCTSCDEARRRGRADRAQGRRSRPRASRRPPARRCSRATSRSSTRPSPTRCHGARPAAARQDEHGRVRHGLVDRELGLRADAQPVGPGARARRLVRRLGGGGRGRSRAVGARLGHRRLDQAARRALRHRRPAADVRHRLALGIVAFASSLDQVGPITKTVRDCALLYRIDRRPRPVRLDHGRAARAGRDPGGAKT